ncbi:hypothetical protein CA831_07060, partial [Burkholderia multivorans]
MPTSRPAHDERANDEAATTAETATRRSASSVRRAHRARGRRIRTHAHRGPSQGGTTLGRNQTKSRTLPSSEDSNAMTSRR